MWKQILLLGIILGALQILLVLGWGLIAQWPSSWLMFGVLSILVFLAISALDGFLTSRRNLEPDAVFSPGFIVGGIAFLVIGVAFMAAPAIFAAPFRPIVCPPGSRCGLGAGIGGALLLIVLGAFFFLEAMFAGPLGGWIGGRLWRRYAAAPSRPSATPENETS